MRSSVFRAAHSYATNPFLSVRRTTDDSQIVVKPDDGDKVGLFSVHKSPYLATLYEELHRLFIKHLAHDYIRSLPPMYLYTLGALCYGIIVAVACFFFFYTYNQQRQLIFLSTEYTQGLCSIVQRPADGTYLADIDGNWQGTNHFVDSKAVYKVTFNNFTAATYGQIHSSKDMYEKLMSTLESIFTKYLEPTFKSQNLPHNLAYMCNYVAAADVVTLDHTINEQIFSLTGDASVVFNMDFVSAGLGDWLNHCDVEPSVKYEASSYFWTITWDYREYMRSAVCSRVLDPASMGFAENKRATNQQFEIKIDVRSFMALVGVNAPFNERAGDSLGSIIFETVLRRISGANFTFEGYDVARYYDYRFPGMKPLVCLKPVTPMASRVGKCMYDFGGLTFGIPYFEHFGANRDMYGEKGIENIWGKHNITIPREPVYCNCSTAEGHGMYGLTSTDKMNFGFKNCNFFDFLHGFLVYGLTQDVSGQARHIFHMLFHDVNIVGQSTLDERGYRAAWYTVPHIRTEDGFVYKTEAAPNISAAQRQDYFSFCNTPWGNCSLLMMRSVNSGAATGRLYSINSQFVQMSNSSCNFEFPSSTFSVLKNRSPVPLQENYYVCKQSDTAALFEAAGTAFGNTAIAVSVAVTLLIHALLLLQYLTGLFVPRTYMQEEKQEILDGIATKILVLRDARHKEEHREQLNLMQSLLNELQATHEQDNVYFVRQSNPADEARRAKADKNWAKALQLLRVGGEKKTAGSSSESINGSDGNERIRKLSVTGDIGNPMYQNACSGGVKAKFMSQLAHSHMSDILELGRVRAETAAGLHTDAGEETRRATTVLPFSASAIDNIPEHVDEAV